MLRQPVTDPLVRALSPMVDAAPSRIRRFVDRLPRAAEAALHGGALALYLGTCAVAIWMTMRALGG